MIIIEKESGVALHFDALGINEECAWGADWVNRHVGTETADAVDILPPSEPISGMWLYLDGEWKKNPAFDDSSIPRPPVPDAVSMRQARLALLSAGLLDNVEAAVSASGHAAQIEWEFAQEVRRDHPLIAVVQAQQAMSDTQIDALFIEAAKR